MGAPNSGEIIPLFSGAHARNNAPGADGMRDLALARRRGLDSVDTVAPVRTSASPPVACPDHLTLTPSRLSALFIESLDDMIRGTPSCNTAGTWPARSNPAIEKVATDIVDMLFGFVLEEPAVPRGIKESLLRAQLPVLQLAMRDTSLFSDWQHPARKLLNETASMVRSFIERGGEAARFESIFIPALNRVLDDLTPNAAAFAELYAILSNAAYEAPTTETTDDNQAWERAQAVVRDFMKKALPPLAREFLAGYWVDVLHRTALTHPVASLQWRDAIEVIEDLAWSLTPKEAQEDRLQLIGLIPALLSRINRGLDLIDLPHDDRRPFFDMLIEVHAAVLRTELTPPAPPAEEAPPIKQIMRLARGDWVEFVRADGSINRERLTWISPQRGILMFSNHQGQGAIQISPEDLAQLVAEQKATLIFDQPESDSGQNSA